MQINWQKIFVPIIAMAILVIFWEWLVWYKGWRTFQMAAPSDLWPAYRRHEALFWQ